MGSRTKNPRTDKPTKQLIELCGADPEAPTAARGKAELRPIRQELKAEGEDPEESDRGAPGVDDSQTS